MDRIQRELYRQLGERLKARRREVGMSQVQLAEAVGLLRTSVTNIEAGRQKSPLHVLYRICAILQVEVAAILPSQAEVSGEAGVPLLIDGRVKNVPPKTAAFLQRLQQRGDRRAHDE